MAKTYDIVKELLTDIPETRDSDKVLVWEYWKEKNMIAQGRETEGITKENFFKSVALETITRCRRKIQEKYPELGETKEGIRKARRKKEKTKGTFIYQE